MQGAISADGHTEVIPVLIVFQNFSDIIINSGTDRHNKGFIPLFIDLFNNAVGISPSIIIAGFAIQ